VQRVAQETVSTSFGKNPRPSDKRRIVAHMLPVATSENGSPIATIILIETDDLLFHFITFCSLTL